MRYDPLVDMYIIDCEQAGQHGEKIAQLQAEVAALRITLGRIERLSGDLLGTMPSWIPKIIVMIVRDINDQAQAALTTDAGRPMLERLRRAEAERDDALDRLSTLAKIFKVQPAVRGGID